ncbi:MAG: hypothetical protein JXB34_05505 [Bacteroidales bacterium]|nr:hypothetical protein [Bacteroidales bacterium]
MEEPEKQIEYEKLFKLDRDVTIRVKLNKPVHDLTLVIGRTVRVDAPGKTVVYETGFLKRNRKKILRKLFFRKISKIFPCLKKFFKPKNKKSGNPVHV